MKSSEIKYDGKYAGRDGKIRRVMKVYHDTNIIYFRGVFRGRYGEYVCLLSSFARWAKRVIELIAVLLTLGF